MTPFTTMIPPCSRAGPQVFEEPSPRPLTTRGFDGPAAPAPPPRPPNPPAPDLSGCDLPSAPQPLRMFVFSHLRLRFRTLLTLTCLSELKRLPVKSPE